MLYHTTGPLNAWIWLADERSEVRIYLQVNTRGSSSRQLSTALQLRITSPKLFMLFQRSYNSNITKTNTTLAKQINILNKRLKMTDTFHVFATQLHFIMYGKHISPTLFPSQTHSLHTLTYALMLVLLWKCYQYSLTLENWMTSHKGGNNNGAVREENELKVSLLLETLLPNTSERLTEVVSLSQIQIQKALLAWQKHTFCIAKAFRQHINWLTISEHLEKPRENNSNNELNKKGNII